MQLNPARGRKLPRDPRVAECYGGLCSSTPRGDGNSKTTRNTKLKAVAAVYAAQPREGTETPLRARGSPPVTLWFMQLNPARGRKRDVKLSDGIAQQVQVYAAQPREGTETIMCGGTDR